MNHPYTQKNKVIASENAAAALFTDVIDYVNKGRFFDFISKNTGQSIFFNTQITKKGRLQKTTSETFKAATHNKPNKLFHIHDMALRKANRNKLKLVNETVEVLFMSGTIGLGVGSVIVAATAVETLGVGTVIGASIGLTISVGTVPLYGIQKVVRKTYTHTKREIFDYRQANKYQNQKGPKRNITDSNVVRSAILKFTHKKLSKLCDEWVDIRKRYLIVKSIEKEVNNFFIPNKPLPPRPNKPLPPRPNKPLPPRPEKPSPPRLNKPLPPRPPKKIKNGVPIVSYKRPCCGDFILSFQHMVILNNAYNNYKNDLDLFDRAFIAVEHERQRAQKDFLTYRQKIISEIKKWFQNDDNATMNKALLKNLFSGSPHSTRDYSLRPVTRRHSHDRCLTTKRFSLHQHHICYSREGSGKGYFDINSIKKINGDRDKKKIEEYKNLYKFHGILRVLEDAAHSRQFQPHYKTLDFLHCRPSHNPKSEVMANDMVHLLGYCSVRDFCTIDEDQQQPYSEKIDQFLKAIKKPLAKSIVNGILNTIANLGSEILPRMNISTDDLTKNFEETFIENTVGKINNLVDLPLDLIETTMTASLEITSNVLSDVSQIGGESIAEAIANFASGGLYTLVKDSIEGSLFSSPVDIAGMVLTVLHIGYSGVVVPVAKTMNKADNLFAYNNTKKYALDSRRGYEHKKSNAPDPKRMKRLRILRSLLKTNGVMEQWEKGYESLKKENDKLKNIAESYRVKNCYDAYNAMRQLLIVKEKLNAMSMSHQVVREFHQGVILKFQKMILKNTMMANRLFKNCKIHYQHTEVNEPCSKTCYHPCVRNETKKFISDKTNLETINQFFEEMVQFKDRAKVASLIENERKVKEQGGKSGETFKKQYAEAVKILEKASKVRGDRIKEILNR